MAKGALFVSWGALIPGREATGAGVLQAALGYLEELRAQGTLDRIEVAALEPAGAGPWGFVLAEGDKDAMARLRVEARFVATIVGVQLVHEDVRVSWAYRGAEMGALFGIWAAQEASLLGEQAAA